jgi:hypothetical protein
LPKSTGDTEKLVQANGNPIDMSLRYVCRSISDETHDFPFSLNSIRFCTVYREDWQKQAAYLQAIIWHHNWLQKALLLHLRLLVTAEMYTQSNKGFTRRISFIKAELAKDSTLPPFDVFGFMKSRAMGDSLSATWGFMGNSLLMDSVVAHVLQGIAKRHAREFAAAIDQVQPGWSASHSAQDFFELTFLPWEIPSLNESMALVEEWQVVEEADLLLG